ncbi:MAG: cation:proton antiporter [Candidatus Kapabacteria bacterium]|nr:cation:proton antiporter [Candidatus Kapabacteria bacterium]
MKNNKFKLLFFYAFVISVFSTGTFLVLRFGKILEIHKFSTEVIGNTLSSFKSELNPHNTLTAFDIFYNDVFLNLHSPLTILFLQIISIIVLSRILGYLCNKIGQPSVIGEIIAGIILGPSILGYYFPSISSYLFPLKSLANLQFLSQIGLILFMFVVGMELDLKLLKNRAQEAVIISHSSIVTPFFMGVTLSYFLYDKFAPINASFIEFALFIGTAMSITAFPVLARIIQEKGLSNTYLGSMAITCAAADDVSAWCILAAVIAIIKAGTFLNAFFNIAAITSFVLFMIYYFKPLIRNLGSLYIDKPHNNKTIMAFVFVILLTSSFVTESLGLQALFGAFLAGVIMPDNLHFKKLLIKKVEDISLVLLLPLFFVFTGLRTQIGLVSSGELWFYAIIVLITAVMGKFFGSTLSARFVGMSWKDSFLLGTLMNTRGLMELIVLNIGYDLGILKPEIFTILVLMALTTTFMTSPILSIINFIFKEKNETEVKIIDTI